MQKTKVHQEKWYLTKIKISTEIKIIKINQTEILNLKNKMTEKKNSIEGSTIDLSMQNKESVILNIRHLKLLILKWRTK